MQREPNDEQLLIEGGDEDVEVEEDEFVNEEEAGNIEGDGPDDPDPPDNGNRIDLRPFTEAVIPGAKPGPVIDDAQGWNQIDTWDAFDCSVSNIVPMEEVPGPFRKI